MAEQLNALNDDTTRADDRVLYLMGFDVSVFATKHQKDQLARVTYTFPNCDARVYQLSPGSSSYNVSEFDAQSHANFFAGALKLLNGIGANADYQRLKEQLHNGVTQNVYVAGFGAGTDTFGWYFAPPPYQQVVSPGVRTVYAFVSMNASCTRGANLSTELRHTVDWVSRKKESPAPTPSDKITLTLPAEGDTLKITKLAYDPVLYPSPVSGTGGDAKHPVVTLQLELSQDIDPNMIITVAGTMLKRVRDWRGRATTPQDKEYYSLDATAADLAKDPCVAKRVNLGRGLLETDQLCPDTWIAATPRTILISIDTTYLGAGFPNVRLHTGRSSTDILSQIDQENAEIRVGENSFRPSKTTGALPRSTFVPLTYAGGVSDAHITVSVSSVNATNVASAIHISAVGPDAAATPIPLDETAQVVLRDMTLGSPAATASLVCAPTAGDLLCQLPQGRDRSMSFMLAFRCRYRKRRIRIRLCLPRRWIRRLPTLNLTLR